jgi:methylamine dehydrogenase accessory protein MauD
MTEALIISNVALWIVVIVLAGVVLALTRQIGVLHERVAPAGALAAERGPRVGEAAPVLEVTDWSGARRTIGGAQGEGRSTLLFFLSPTCPVCKTLLPTLRSVLRAEAGWLRLVWASDGAREEHEAFVREEGLDAEAYVLSTELGLAYQVAKLPYAVLLDEAGVVRAKGLVNTREHLESLFEAKERGVASIQDYVARERGGRRVA